MFVVTTDSMIEVVLKHVPTRFIRQRKSTGCNGFASDRLSKGKPKEVKQRSYILIPITTIQKEKFHLIFTRSRRVDGRAISAYLDSAHCGTEVRLHLNCVPLEIVQVDDLRSSTMVAIGLYAYRVLQTDIVPFRLPCSIQSPRNIERSPVSRTRHKVAANVNHLGRICKIQP